MLDVLQTGRKADGADPLPSTAWTALTRRELVGRIVASRSFAKSERLSSLLTYVCDMALKGRGSELNEQKIGRAVFGRPADYDSSIDGIVRTQASRLRQRLEFYFKEEGADEPIRIEIPKGGYVPVFVAVAHGASMAGVAVERSELATLTLSDDIAAVPIETAAPSTRWLPWVLCAGLALACAALLASRHAAAVKPHPLWSLIFTQGRPTLEVPGDSGLVISYRFTQKGVTLNEYLAGKYRSSGEHAKEKDPPGSPPLQEDLSTRRYTSFVDLEIASSLATLAAGQESALQIRYARDLRPNDLKSGNAVLVGAFEGNPWLELFEGRMNFAFVNNYETNRFAVINHAPRNGEPDHWESAPSDPLKRVYGVVALVPNLSGTGNVLIVEGTSMAGVEAAWDFVSDDAELLPFLHRIQRPDGTVPSFEVLIETRNTGASAAHGELITWRAGS